MQCKSLSSDVQKAVEAAGVLLRMESTARMGRLRLLKLLYIANRRAINELGRPILRGPVVAMKHGPVHSAVFDLIKENHVDADRWATFIRRDGPRNLHLVKQPPLGTLSKLEIEILQTVFDDLSGMEDYEIVDLTHSFPEWENNYPNKSESTSRPIPLEDLVRSAAQESDVESILEAIRDQEDFDRLFAS